MKTAAKRIAVIAPDQESYPTVMGVVQYGRQKANWNVFVELDSDLAAFKRLSAWKGHGVIAHVGTPQKAQAIRNLKIPVVNISSALKRSAAPRVTTDQEAIGELAARHLLERGFTRFAFLGATGLWFSKLRQQGFERCVAAAGHRCDSLEVKQDAHYMLFWGRHTEPVAKWLKTLQPPVGHLLVGPDNPRASIRWCLHSATASTRHEPVSAEYSQSSEVTRNFFPNIAPPSQTSLLSVHEMMSYSQSDG